MVGSRRQGDPARTIQRNALKTSRRSLRRCGASGVIKVEEGATNAHASTVTSSDTACAAQVHFPSLKPTKFITDSRPAAPWHLASWLLRKALSHTLALLLNALAGNLPHQIARRFT